MADGSHPEDAFKAGSQTITEQVFVARAKHNNGMLPGQLNEGLYGAQMPYGGKIGNLNIPSTGSKDIKFPV